MVHTGQTQAPAEEMIECVAVAEASRLSGSTGDSARLCDVVNTGTSSRRKTDRNR